MTRFTTLGMLAMATSVLAMPQNHGYAHVSLHRSGVHPSASGIKSHYLPSGTKASSVVKPKSKSKSHSLEHESKSTESTKSIEAMTASYDSVPTSDSYMPAAAPYQYDAVNAGVDSSSCTDQLTITTKIQVTVTVTTQEQYPSSEAAVSSAYNVDHHGNPLPEVSSISKEHSSGSKKHHVASASASASLAKPSSRASSSKRQTSHVTESHKSSSEVAAKSSETHKTSSSEAATKSSESAKPSSSEAAISSFESAMIPSFSVPAVSVSISVPATSEYVAPTTSTTSTHATASLLAAVSSIVDDKVHAPIFSPFVTSTPVAATSSKVSSAQVVATSASSSTSTGSGKRGLAYNDASMITGGFLNNPQITWAWNWASSGTVPSGISFIPTLWGLKSTSSWKTNAQAAINSGSTHLFSFNEPDNAGQANLTVQQAVSNYQTYINNDFAGGKTKLCAPAVTNGGGQTGLNYLSQFLGNCTTSCQIDCINIHWYGTEESDLEKHIEDTIAIAGGREIWLSEFGLVDNAGKPVTSAATVEPFLSKALPFLDGKQEVTGYAYFMVDPTIMTSSNGIGSSYADTAW